MTEREALFRIEAILRISKLPVNGGWEIQNVPMKLINESIREALNKGDKNAED